MVVRLFAVLLALGMLVISVQGSGTPTTGSGDTAALVQCGDADDAPPIAIIESPAVVPDRSHAQSVLPEPGAPAGHRPEIMIFRPPRAAAFV